MGLLKNHVRMSVPFLFCVALSDVSSWGAEHSQTVSPECEVQQAQIEANIKTGEANQKCGVTEALSKIDSAIEDLDNVQATGNHSFFLASLRINAKEKEMCEQVWHKAPLITKAFREIVPVEWKHDLAFSKSKCPNIKKSSKLRIGTDLHPKSVTQAIDAVKKNMDLIRPALITCGDALRKARDAVENDWRKNCVQNVNSAPRGYDCTKEKHAKIKTFYKDIKQNVFQPLVFNDGLDNARQAIQDLSEKGTSCAIVPIKQIVSNLAKRQEQIYENRLKPTRRKGNKAGETPETGYAAPDKEPDAGVAH